MENNNNISDPFNTPEGYFNRSKASILNKAEWLSEHEAYPLLLSLKDRSGFIVPPNYFESSSSQLELVNYLQLHSLIKKSPYKVPANYFVQSKLSLTDKCEQHNEIDAFDTLKRIQKIPVLKVNDTYFEESKARILRSNTPVSETKIISMNRKPLWFAAAAVLTIALSLWIYTAFFNQQVAIDEDCHTLACIEKRELLKFKLDNIDNEDLYDLVNTEKLEKKLNTALSTDSLKNSDSIDTSILDEIE